MDQSEILALMIEAAPQQQPEWDFVLAEYAARLAKISPKLTEKELYEMMAIGASIYQKWCSQSASEKETTKALLDLMRRPKG